MEEPETLNNKSFSRMARMVAVMLLIAVAIVVFPKRHERPAVTGGERPIIIGISYQNLENEYIQGLQAAIRRTAKEKGVAIIEKDGKGKVENQVTQVEEFIAQHVDAIILNPYNKDGAGSAVEKAKEAGIPLIVLNAQVDNLEAATAYVGSDDLIAGRMEAQLIVDHLGGRGNVVIMHIQGGNSAQISRTEGIKEVLSQYPEIKILAEQTANGNREHGRYLMDKWLRNHPDIDALISQNDAMALGAYEAIKRAGREREIAIVGIDAIPEALEAVRKGEMLGTVLQDADGQGSTVIEIAIRAARGETVPHINYLPFRLITAENVHEVIGE